MIKYVWLAVLLCALAGCGKARLSSLDERQEEGSDEAMVEEKQQPMLLRGDARGAPILCMLAVEPPAARYQRILAEHPARFGSRGHAATNDGTAVREIPLEAFNFGFSPSIIAVKKGERVRFIVTSRDVVHGISLREYGINVPVRRGEMRTIEFIAGTAGDFVIRCPVYCGQGHAQMTARLIVEE